MVCGERFVSDASFVQAIPALYRVTVPKTGGAIPRMVPAEGECTGVVLQRDRRPHSRFEKRIWPRLTSAIGARTRRAVGAVESRPWQRDVALRKITNECFGKFQSLSELLQGTMIRGVSGCDSGSPGN